MRTSLLLAGVLLAAPAAAQSPSFSIAGSTSVDAPRAIATADFNRDGWMDYATAGTGRDSVGIHLSRGAVATFVFAHEILVEGGPFEMKAGDLNRDAIPDLVIANADLHTITILLGRGDGSFHPKTDIPVAGNPRGLTLADHDRDGTLDIFVTRYMQGSWTVFYGDGEGGTRAETTLVAGSNPQGIATADFNNDGILDVVIANASSGVTAYYSDSRTTWTGATVPGSRAGNVLASGDFDRDGWQDLAVASTAASVLSLYRGGPGGLEWIADLGTGSSPRGILAADLNQDGLLDIVTANRAANTLSIFPGRADAPWQFAPVVTQHAAAGSRAVATADFNHDGRLDMVSSNELAGAASVMLNTTDLVRAGFSFHVEQPIGPNQRGYGSPDILEVADFDRNGLNDYLIAATIRFDGTTRSLTLPVSSIEDAVIDDFTRDGQLDIAVLSYWENHVRIFAGDGRGGFTALAPQPVPQGFDFETADLNRDGSPDLLVRLSSSTLRVLYNRGDGTFALGGDVHTRSALFYFTIADMNRDGYQDFVTGHTGPVGAGVIYGDAAGAWLRTEFYPTGEADACCGRLQAADFNEDGPPDIVLLSRSSLFFFAGQSGGGFAAPVVQSGADYSYRMTTTDIDLDGHLDLVMPASDIFFGRGDGTFELRKFRFYEEGGTQAIDDFNRDGLPDIVSGTIDWFTVMVNERNATNRNPVANAGLDHTETYGGQFGEETTELDAYRSTDPDLHELTYEWRNEAGEVLSREQYFSPRFPSPGTYTFTLIARDAYGGSSTDTVTWTITPFKEIVLYTDYALNRGAWRGVQDPTAAGGWRMVHPDEGAPKVNTPLAAPSNYIEISFHADPTQTYKLWIRGKAERDYWGNDSVWVQFNGAVASDGATYAIGTTSALPWNLEECSGCGISGWGWEDDAWGAPDRNGVTLRFPNGGYQTIRIQTREDGVSIDQIVLSSEQFLTTRPGSAKNDRTILNRTY